MPLRPVDLPAIIAARAKEDDGKTCRAFLLCDRPATTTMPHPILGEVAACDRCREKVARLSA